MSLTAYDNHSPDGDRVDQALRQAILAMPFPATPSSVRNIAMQRITEVRRPQERQKMLAAVACCPALLLACAIVWQPPNSHSQLKPQAGSTEFLIALGEDHQRGEFDREMIEVLSAMPPVEMLSVLNQRIDITMRMLNAQETIE